MRGVPTDWRAGGATPNNQMQLTSAPKRTGAHAADLTVSWP